MDKKFLTIGIVILILIIGLIIPQFIESVTPCTLMMCYPNEPTAEIPCNLCTQSQPIFVTGIINIIKVCKGTDILVFENSVHISEKDRVEIDYNNCEYKIKFIAIRD